MRSVKHLWKHLAICAIALSVAYASGCTYYMPAAVSSTSIGNQGEVPVKVVSGRSEASYFLAFGPFGDDSLLAALEDARSKGDGDTLANVFVDRKLFCVPHCGFALYTSIETKVTGTLVKYQDARSSQFQKPVAQPPIAGNSQSAVAVLATELAYKQLAEAFRQGPATAKSLFASFGGPTKDQLRKVVLSKFNRTSALSWRVQHLPSTPDDEKPFLNWFLTANTDYKVERN